MWLLDGSVGVAVPSGTDLYHVLLIALAMQVHKWVDRILLKVFGSNGAADPRK